MKNKPTLNKQEAVERNFIFADMRAVDDGKPMIVGHAAVYGQEAVIAGLFKEVIVRGAFDETDFEDVLFSTNHDLRKIPLARSRRNNANSTMELRLDNDGLFVRANLDTENNADARALYSSVNRGDIDGMSFIFYVEEERWEGLDSDMPTRYIEKIRKVKEVSAVNFPAYTGTDINAREAALDSAKTALDNARAASGGLDNPNELEVLRLKIKIAAQK